MSTSMTTIDRKVKPKSTHYLIVDDVTKTASSDIFETSIFLRFSSYKEKHKMRKQKLKQKIKSVKLYLSKLFRMMDDKNV